MKTLLGMTEFVLEQWEFAGKEEIQKYYSIAKYAYFLNQPLSLGMFVPTDENGNVLEQPKAGMFGYEHIYNNYNKAKENVLFEGVEILKDDDVNYISFKLNKIAIFVYDKNLKSFVVQTDWNIEKLIKYNLTITETAIKKYKL